jgi:DtxR family transcriptional regulator, Mn-dependent transcriptional regulator
MRLTDNAEEILESLWAELVEGGKHSCDVALLRHEVALAELIKHGHVELVAGKATLSKKGRDAARDCVRRHRLAERLLVDVLNMKKSLVHEPGCLFEHILHAGLDENVCTLLGHPRLCPHGREIPEGKCCIESRRQVGKLITALPELEIGARGEVAYLQTRDAESLQKLMAMGILPRTELSLMRKSPTIVFETGKTQFAIDTELASRIFVRRLK